MPLDRDTLETSLASALRENFRKGTDQAWSSDQAANAMARAIADAVHAYAGGARVTGVQTQVHDPAHNLIGAGTQTGSVGLS